MLGLFSKKQEEKIEILAEDEGEFIIGIFTSNFDEMTAFFKTLEIEMRDTKMNQLSPLFNDERSVTLWVGNKLIANIEENTAFKSSACFNLFVIDTKYTEEKLEHIAKVLKQRDCVANIYGGFIYTFISPDGGKIAIASE